jgi:hypothetical protein
MEVTQKNVAEIVKAGRCLWKIENECFNTLKDQGYPPGLDYTLLAF